MKWYADQPSQRTRQQAADAIVLLCGLLLLRLGQLVHSAVEQLGGLGIQLEKAGAGLAGGLSESGRRVGDAPLVGNGLSGPLDVAAGAARAVSSAGTSERQAVHWLALVLGVTIALLPLIYLIWQWLPRRLRYAREAGAAQHLGDDIELLALRAATSSPLRELARLGPDPVTRWRRGEPGAARELAALELSRLGLQGPADSRDPV
jgi:hypothetical protein